MWRSSELPISICTNLKYFEDISGSNGLLGAMDLTYLRQIDERLMKETIPPSGKRNHLPPSLFLNDGPLLQPGSGGGSEGLSSCSNPFMRVPAAGYCPSRASALHSGSVVVDLPFSRIGCYIVWGLVMCLKEWCVFARQNRISLGILPNSSCLSLTSRKGRSVSLQKEQQKSKTDPLWHLADSTSRGKRLLARTICSVPAH